MDYNQASDSLHIRRSGRNQTGMETTPQVESKQGMELRRELFRIRLGLAERLRNNFYFNVEECCKGHISTALGDFDYFGEDILRKVLTLKQQILIGLYWEVDEFFMERHIRKLTGLNERVKWRFTNVERRIVDGDFLDLEECLADHDLRRVILSKKPFMKQLNIVANTALPVSVLLNLALV